MMKMVFLFFCVFTLMAADDGALSYKTIDINGFQTEQKDAAGELEKEAEFELEKVEPAKEVVKEEVQEEEPEQKMAEPAEQVQRPRLTALEKQKLRRKQVQRYNNDLLREGIERLACLEYREVLCFQTILQDHL